MTDNSYELFYPPYLNNPKSCPKNMNAYLPHVLSETQQSKTDNAKIKMARHNQKYLGAHPEIKAIVSLILRNLFIHRPVNIHEFVGKFVSREQFPDEIAQFLVEQLNVQFTEEEDEEEPKAPESMEATHDSRLNEIHQKATTPVDHRFLKKMLYGADPHSLRHSQEQHDGSHVALSYDQLLKMMRSGSSVNHDNEETLTTGFNDSGLEEEEEEEEEVSFVDTSFDDADNEEALLEGQRLIFAMLGKKLTPSPSTSDISMPSMHAGQPIPKKHPASVFESIDDGTDNSIVADMARVSVYSTYEPGKAEEIRPEDEEEDEEYFDKD